MQLVQWLKLLREDGSISEEQRTHLSIQLLEVLQNSTTALDSLLVSHSLLVSQSLLVSHSLLVSQSLLVTHSIHISTCIQSSDPGHKRLELHPNI